MKINSIDEVIAVLTDIIIESENNNDPRGYFAALYRSVTKKVKEGIKNNEFDDGARMEKLDVIFAKRYIDAYYAYKKNEAITVSWQEAFKLSTTYWPIVLQHLLIGMNAHISLDLGIAAAEISRNENIEDLKNDFNKINEVLSSLVSNVENDLAEIWPMLKVILKLAGRVDDFLVDFSMGIARDGAWKFAISIANGHERERDSLIKERDQKVANIANMILHPGFIAKTIIRIIRVGERGSVSQRIINLKK